MDKIKALQIWERLFGDKDVAYDFASHPMKKEDFQNQASHYGWDIDFKSPYIPTDDNCLPCSLNTISFRQKKTSFKVGNNLFEVRRGERRGTFSIYDVTDRNNPINTDPTIENQDPEYNKKRFHLLATSALNPIFKEEEHFMIPTASSISENAFMNRLEEDNFDEYQDSEIQEKSEEQTVDNDESIVEEVSKEQEEIDPEFTIDENIENIEEESEDDSKTCEEMIESTKETDEQKEVVNDESITSQNDTIKLEEIKLDTEIDKKDDNDESKFHQLFEDESLDEEIVEEQNYEDNSLTPQEENEKLNLKIEELKKENDKLHDENNSLNEKRSQLKADLNQLDAQAELVDDQIDILSLENNQLSNQLNELKSKYDEVIKENDNFKEENESLYNKLIKTQEEKKVILEEKDRLVARAELLSNKIALVESEKNDREQQLVNEKTNTEYSLKNKDDTISSLQSELDKSMRLILLINCFGDPDYIEEVENILKESSLPYNEETVKKVLEDNPQYKKKKDDEISSIKGTSALVYDGETEYNYIDKYRKEKAYNYYSKIYGEDKNTVSDYAGRYINLDDYLDTNSDCGWDYALINPNEEESLDNIFIANIKSIKEYRFDTIFESNDHKYKVIKENGKYKISSDDFITDPYDFSQAMRITKSNLEETSTMIYIFMKAVGINTSEINNEYLMELFSLLDRTVKRCCPHSFIEMKSVIGSGKGNYALITFDGSVKEAYREVLDYALLLNSYRREFRNEEKLNAVIVLNELEIPYSKRHFDFDALLNETRDDELRALRYEFNMTVINSTIKRTIHIGPRILDKLAIDQSSLKPSQIGSGNFAKMYNFSKEFKVYNFVYSLTHKEENVE